MYLVYSIVLTLGFLLMTPLFLLRREKYAAGFRERMGNYPSFVHAGSRVIWLHCVSVGEVNAARPLVERIPKSFPDYRVVVSTSTKTGRSLRKRGLAAVPIRVYPFGGNSVSACVAAFKRRFLLMKHRSAAIYKRGEISGDKIAIVHGKAFHTARPHAIRCSPVLAKYFATSSALMQAKLTRGRLTF